MGIRCFSILLRLPTRRTCQPLPGTSFVQYKFYSSPSSPPLAIRFQHGLPVLSVPLPSRGESCLFTLRPLTDSVGSLCESLQTEDKGIDYAAVYAPDGARISSTTVIEHLLQFDSFRLRINDTMYDVLVDRKAEALNLSSDNVRQLNDLRATVSSLHAVLCVDEYQLQREKLLAKELEEAEKELVPLEEVKNQIAADCDAHSNRTMWTLFAVMGVQTGIFARLTWWDYSWDIMEPVTYFATYATIIGSTAYYLYAKQPFEYSLVQGRIFTRQFYKRAQAVGFNVEEYNKLVEKVLRLRAELSRLRDPLHHHLPINRLTRIEAEKIKQLRL